MIRIALARQRGFIAEIDRDEPRHLAERVEEMRRLRAMYSR
jgi:hypothetical protein